MSPPIDRHHTSARMSKIVCHAGLVFLCGQTSSGCTITDVAGQTREVLARVDGLLAEAGTERSRLLSVTIHLKDIEDFAAMNAVWDAWVPAGTAPARTTVEAHLAAPDLRVEMTVVAARVDPGGQRRSEAHGRRVSAIERTSERTRSAPGRTGLLRSASV